MSAKRIIAVTGGVVENLLKRVAMASHRVFLTLCFCLLHLPITLLECRKPQAKNS
jgi:hypothetical protein